MDKLTSKRRTTALGRLPGMAPTELTDILKQGFVMLHELKIYENSCDLIMKMTNATRFLPRPPCD